MRGGLYRLDDKSFEMKKTALKVSGRETSVLLTDSDVPLSILHARLGHTSLSKMRHISICKCSDMEDFYCEVCVLAKHHRLPFTRSESIASMPFELVHFDLWGPYKVPSLCGARYFLTVLDDNTRCTWTYLLQNKEQVLGTIAKFIAMVETQFKSCVQKVRTEWESGKKAQASNRNSQGHENPC